MTIGTVTKTARPRQLDVDEAVALLRVIPPAVGVEQVAVADALGRVLAEEVVAPRPVPAHDSSAMDGYAVRFADLADSSRLPLQGRVAAGHPLGEPLLPGHAVRIFTGAVMPDGADTVALQEECEQEECEGDDGPQGRYVVLPEHLVEGANRRPAGEDMAAGSVVLDPGTRLRPQHIGVATAVGRTELTVRRRLRAGVIATGDELRPPGEPLPPGCIHDTNRHTVTAALRALGAEVSDYGILADSRAAIRAAIATAAAENDVVLSTGGVSVGEEDHVRAAVEEIGRLEFWRLPIKPGRPVAVGEVAGVPFVGLPGNPVAAMVSFWLVGRPLVLRLAGAADVAVPRFRVEAGFAHRRAPGRREFLRCRVEPGPGGTARALLYPRAGSGMVRSLAWADGLVELLETDGDVAEGDLVRYIPYATLDT